MRTCFALILFILTASTCFAGRFELPLGGELSYDSKVWEVQKVPGAKTLMIFHRSMKGLQGAVFDGTVTDRGACDLVSKVATCEKTVGMKKDVSYQILSQKMLAPKVYQNYIYAFNFPKAKEKEYLAQLFLLKKSISEGK